MMPRRTASLVLVIACAVAPSCDSSGTPLTTAPAAPRTSDTTKHIEALVFGHDHSLGEQFLSCNEDDTMCLLILPVGGVEPKALTSDLRDGTWYAGVLVGERVSEMPFTRSERWPVVDGAFRIAAEPESTARHLVTIQISNWVAVDRSKRRVPIADTTIANDMWGFGTN
jgi:hypothetical protein